MVAVKGDGKEVGFQNSGYFSRLLKRKRIHNHALLAIVNLTLNINPNLTLLHVSFRNELNQLQK